ncbi:HSP20-like chaperone [Cunninghamella echinulata]|nr:HSP20-like chaperone [Cunninghamella echinulata]
MALSNRLFSEALRDFNRAFSLLGQPTLFEPAIGNSVGRQFLNSRYPPTDVLETDSGYELHAEIPGVQKQDIDIQVPDDHTLVLKGEIKYAKTEGNLNQETIDQQQAQKDEGKGNESTSTDVVATSKDTSVTSTTPSVPHWWRSERVTGSFSRSFSFPQTIDANAIKAQYKDGVLQVTVPKVEKSPVRVSIE